MKGYLHLQIPNKAGYFRSFSFLGLCFEKGISVDQDTKRAIRYYKDGGRCNDAGSLALLGKCFHKGIGTKANVEKANVSWMIAVNSGEPISRYFLALNYLNGNGVKIDIDLALDLLEESSLLGFKDAERELQKLKDENYQLSFLESSPCTLR